MDPLSIVFSQIAVNFLGACIGGAVGNRADKVYCDVMRGLVERLHEGDLPVNGDVQRGIRTAYIQATLVVIDKCLAQLGVEPTTVGKGLGRFGIQSTIVGRRRDKVGHGDGEEVAWLEDVQRVYREELRNLPDNNAPRPTPHAPRPRPRPRRGSNCCCSHEASPHRIGPSSCKNRSSTV